MLVLQTLPLPCSHQGSRSVPAHVYTPQLPRLGLVVPSPSHVVSVLVRPPNDSVPVPASRGSVPTLLGTGFPWPQPPCEAKWRSVTIKLPSTSVDGRVDRLARVLAWPPGLGSSAACSLTSQCARGRRSMQKRDPVGTISHPSWGKQAQPAIPVTYLSLPQFPHF
jgi:hypothetical protein